MLTQYIQAAMKHAHVRNAGRQDFYGSIPASMASGQRTGLEACRKNFKSPRRLDTPRRYHDSSADWLNRESMAIAARLR